MATVGLGYWGENKTVVDFKGNKIGDFTVTGSRKTPRSYLSDHQYTLHVYMGDGKQYTGFSGGKSLIITGRLKSAKKNPSSPKNRAAKSINRPSQMTRAKPSKRLKARRTIALTRPRKGYFPNPKRRKIHADPRPYRHVPKKRSKAVQHYMKTGEASFMEKTRAVQYAHAIANATGKPYSVRRVGRVYIVAPAK